MIAMISQKQILKRNLINLLKKFSKLLLREANKAHFTVFHKNKINTFAIQNAFSFFCVMQL